ncbi:MAG: hypothetical protein ACT4NL_14150, partial [Pseudomarimonas sp.]
LRTLSKILRISLNANPLYIPPIKHFAQPSRASYSTFCVRQHLRQTFCSDLGVRRAEFAATQP